MRGVRARSKLEGTRFADLRWVAETGSTNADLLEAARAGARDGVVLAADHQRAGRGRLDRTWEAPAGSSLLVSILFRPRLAVGHLHLLTTAVALAARQACAEVAGWTPALKWPNDLLDPASGRKLAGVLAESQLAGDRVEAVVVGIGLNVTWPEGAPAELADIAVDLATASGRAVDREDLLAALLVDLDRRTAHLDDPDGRADLVAAQRHACATLGRQVRVQRADGSTGEGLAAAITDAGALVVEPAGGGPAEVISVGDVVHLRHA